jgi:hypothetical protein
MVMVCDGEKASGGSVVAGLSTGHLHESGCAHEDDHLVPFFTRPLYCKCFLTAGVSDVCYAEVVYVMMLVLMLHLV